MIQKNQHMKQFELHLESIDCRYYNSCHAPMCPKDVNYGRCLWFPSEPVCRLKEVPDWILKQRKISKLKHIDQNKCFTLRILNAIDEVISDLEGIDPEYYGGEKRWLSKHSRKNSDRDISESDADTDSEITLEIDARTHSMFF